MPPEELSYAATRRERLKNIQTAIEKITLIEQQIRAEPKCWAQHHPGVLHEGNLFVGCITGHIANQVQPLENAGDEYRTTIGCQEIIDTHPIGGFMHDAVEAAITGEAHGYWDCIISWNDRSTTLVQDVVNVLAKARMFLGNLTQGEERDTGDDSAA